MNWYFFIWRDVIEILFFSTLFYYFNLFLRADKQNNLIIYFYMYCALFFSAHFIQLTAIENFLLLATPAFLALFIILHHRSLQHNFVFLKKVQSALVSSDHWLELLIRSCLVGASHNKDILCIIEHNDSIQNYINITVPCTTPLHENALAFFIKSSLFDTTKFIVATSQGQLHGINAEFNYTLDDIWIHNNAKNIPAWQQYGLKLTQNSDALVLKLHADQHTFTIMIHETIYTHIDAHNAIKLISQYLRTKKISGSGYKGLHHDTYRHNKNTQNERVS